MLVLIIWATYVVMLGIIWFNEGWKKVLKIIGAWLGSVLLWGVIMVLLGSKPGSELNHITALLLEGAWAVGLVLYNIKEGYIGRF